MSLAIVLYLAAAAAPALPTDTAEHRLSGARTVDARVTAQILRTAVLREDGVVFSDGEEGPRTQQVRHEGRITYEFE